MQVFHIRYRNTQGTLMRILNAVSRRGLDLPSVQAQAAERDHSVSLVLEVNPKQMGQLYREWYSIVDVTEVGSRAARDGPARIRQLRRALTGNRRGRRWRRIPLCSLRIFFASSAIERPNRG